MTLRLSDRWLSCVYAGLAAVEGIYFSLLYLLPPIRFYNVGALQNYDYGYYFDLTYHLSRFGPLYLTTRGAHAWCVQRYFAAVLAVAHYLPAPHYVLLMTHSLGILAVGFFCMYFWRSNKTLSLLMPVVAWLSPFMVNMNLDLIHVDAFITIFFLLMAYSALQGWPRRFYVFLLLSLSCKEDVSITAGVFMLLALYRPALFKLPSRNFRAGIALCVSLFLFNEMFVLPHYKLKTCEWLVNNFQAQTMNSSMTIPWFPNIYKNLFHPAFYKACFGKKEVARYLILLLWPVLLFLRSSFPLCLLVLPGAIINIFGGAYLIEGYWHYDSLTFASVLLAVLVGLEKARRKKAIALVLTVITVALNLKLVSVRTRISDMGSRSFWDIKKVPQVRFLEGLNRKLPEGLVISSDYASLNYLIEGHPNVYMYPNPFQVQYFGIAGVCGDQSSLALTHLPVPDLVLLQSFYRIDPLFLLRRSYRLKRIHIPSTGIEFSIYLNSQSAFRNQLESIFNAYEAGPWTEGMHAGKPS